MPAEPAASFCISQWSSVCNIDEDFIFLCRIDLRKLVVHPCFKPDVRALLPSVCFSRSRCLIPREN